MLTLSSCISTENSILINTTTPTKTPAPTQTSTPASTPTQTPIVNRTTSGTIHRNETWRGEILITGDIIIPQGVTLLIEPGTIVRLTGQSDDAPVLDASDLQDTAEYLDFPNDPPRIGANMITISILGEVIANGTQRSPIVFTSNSASPALNDWESLAVEENGKLDLSFAVIEYNYHGIDIRFVKNPNVQIRNTTFRHIAGCCICTGGGTPISTEIIIQGNTFSDCNHEGIDTYNDQNLVIINNLFEDNNVAIVANNGSTVKIESNIFRDNRRCAIGIYTSSSPEIHFNNFIDEIKPICTSNPKPMVDATNNYWGTQYPSSIANGYVFYEPFSTTPFDIPIPIGP